MRFDLVKWGTFVAATAGLGMAVAITACSEPPQPPPPAVPAADVSAAHGKYLVDTHACHDCHTPWKMGAKGPEPDMTRLLSGHPASIGALKLPPAFPKDSPWVMAAAGTNTAWAGPWGISYTMNLTPDQNTGIGIWTEKMFMDALRTGKHMGTASSRDILPPMPWPSFGQMTDDELKAIYAYLRTIPAIANRVPDPTPPAGAPPAASKKG
jgi:mono/diheme cytochrome c family protein